MMKQRPVKICRNNDTCCYYYIFPARAKPRYVGGDWRSKTLLDVWAPKEFEQYFGFNIKPGKGPVVGMLRFEPVVPAE